TFSEEEDHAAGASPVIVLSHGLWSRVFAGDPSIVGAKVTLNRQPYTIIGVMARGFQGFDLLGQPMLWVPGSMYGHVLERPQWYTQRRARFWYAVARLKDGISIGQAEAAMKTLAAQLEQEYPADNEGQTIQLLPIAESTVNPVLRATLA